jgi:hypothetical protein
MAITNAAASALRAIAGVAACMGAFIICSTSAHALLISTSKYCSSGPDDQIVSDTVPSSLLSLSDVGLTIGSTTYGASDCYGDFDPGASNATIETGALNDIFGGLSDPIKLYHLDGSGQTASATGLGGITFVVGTTTGDDEGNWTVTWTDSNPSAPENLPLYVDFVLLLNGGNNNAAYLLSSVLLPTSPTSGSGTFDIQFLNNGGQQPNISHLTLAGRIGSGPEIIQVPEPASMALFGAGLLGLGLLSRRRERAAGQSLSGWRSSPRAGQL